MHRREQRCAQPYLAARVSVAGPSPGQTGSGKTFTMGSGFTPGGPVRGVIPEVMQELFDRVAAGKEGVEYSVRVSFVEIHKV
jgi:hypothetical protein